MISKQNLKLFPQKSQIYQTIKHRKDLKKKLRQQFAQHGLDHLKMIRIFCMPECQQFVIKVFCQVCQNNKQPFMIFAKQKFLSKFTLVKLNNVHDHLINASVFKRLKQKAYINFNFPGQRLKYKRTRSIKDVERQLQQEAGVLGIKNTFFQVVESQEQQQNIIESILFKCGECDAKLEFRKFQNKPQYILSQFSNLHIHMTGLQSQAPHKQKQANKTKQLYKFLRNLNRYNFSIKYYPCNQLHSMSSQVKTSKIFLLLSPKMMYNYKYFGEMMYVKLHFVSVCDQKSDVSSKILGVFLGKDNFNRFVCFGQFMIHQSKCEETNFERIILTFSMLFEEKIQLPETIITDHSGYSIKLIKQLRKKFNWNGYHLYDAAEIQLWLLNQAKNNQIREKLVKCLSTKDSEKYKMLLQQSKTMVRFSEDMELIEEFQQESTSHCISKTPYCFHGLDSSTYFYFDTAINFKIFENAKSTVSTLKTLVFEVFDEPQYDLPKRNNVSIIRVNHQFDINAERSSKGRLIRKGFNEEIERKIEKIAFSKDKTILQFYQAINKDCPEIVAKKVTSNFREAFNYKILKNTSEKNAIILHHLTQNKSQKVLMHRETKEIFCTCGEKQKTKLPCCHLLKIYKECEEVNKNWGIDNRWKYIWEPHLLSSQSIQN